LPSRSNDPAETPRLTGIEARAADAALVKRCRNGDLGAFEDLYQQHARRLYNLARRMSGSTEDAEDLLQEIFLLAFRKLDSFKGDSALGTWLYRLAMNLCLDRLRSKAARYEQATTALEDYHTQEASRASHRELAVSRLDLEAALAHLPEGCKAVFLLHDVEGFEHREIGEILGIAEGTSKSQVHKARMKIREFLTARHESAEGLAPGRPSGGHVS
jgi:RNA polymerase sigma-70 factor (ECF subfamily)